MPKEGEPVGHFVSELAGFFTMGAARSASILLLAAAAAALFLSMQVLCSDPDMLQDFCVADLNSTVKVNGFVCKSNATADDFSSAAISKPGNTSNKLGAVVTAANVLRYPGINTLGVSSARIDYAVGGLNPPHVHPRGTELIFLVQGKLYVGFVTSTADNRLFAKTISAGETFVFPRGLIHFQLNVANETAFVLAAFNSQNPGTSPVAKATFASNPAIADAVLEKAFQISQGEIQHLRTVISKT